MEKYYQDIRFSFLLMIIYIVLLPACQKTKTDKSKTLAVSSSYSNAIKISIEDSLLYDGKVVPYLEPPFYTGQSIAQNKSIKNYIIMSPNRPKSDQCIAIPIADISLRLEEQTNSYILANVLINDKPYLNATNYEEFAVRYASVKQIIDLWLNNYMGLGQSKVLQWTAIQH